MTYVAQYLQKNSKQNTGHMNIQRFKKKKKEIKNAESAYNSQVAGTQNRTCKKNGSPKYTNTMT